MLANLATPGSRSPNRAIAFQAAEYRNLAFQVAATPWTLPVRVAQAGFDALRIQHAAAVRCGAVPLSLRGSARFERWVDTLEKAALGPLARRV